MEADRYNKNTSGQSIVKGEEISKRGCIGVVKIDILCILFFIKTKLKSKK